MVCAGGREDLTPALRGLHESYSKVGRFVGTLAHQGSILGQRLTILLIAPLFTSVLSLIDSAILKFWGSYLPA
jgi:hypothetical protein